MVRAQPGLARDAGNRGAGRTWPPCAVRRVRALCRRDLPRPLAARACLGRAPLAAWAARVGARRHAPRPHPGPLPRGEHAGPRSAALLLGQAGIRASGRPRPQRLRSDCPRRRRAARPTARQDLGDRRRRLRRLRAAREPQRRPGRAPGAPAGDRQRIRALHRRHGLAEERQRPARGLRRASGRATRCLQAGDRRAARARRPVRALPPRGEAPGHLRARGFHRARLRRGADPALPRHVAVRVSVALRGLRAAGGRGAGVWRARDRRTELVADRAGRGRGGVLRSQRSCVYPVGSGTGARRR